MTATNPSRAAAKPHFCCLLDDQPVYLVPARLLRAEVASNPLLQLQVNPRCWFARDEPISQRIGQRGWLPSELAEDPAIVWVRDVATKTLTPFWLGPRYRSLLAGARPGGPVPPGLPADAREVLSFAAVFVDAGYHARRQKQWTETIQLAARRFEAGYAPLRGLIHPYLIGALRTYYRRCVRTGAFKLGDKRTKLRFAAHNERVAAFFHHQLTDVVSRMVGEPVKPSYTYLAAYQSGAELTTHIDREQCEFSISFLVDASPEPERESPWPLHLETPQGRVTVFQCIGDGLLYKGRELPHYRTRLPQIHRRRFSFITFVRISKSRCDDVEQTGKLMTVAQARLPPSYLGERIQESVVYWSNPGVTLAARRRSPVVGFRIERLLGTRLAACITTFS